MFVPCKPLLEGLRKPRSLCVLPSANHPHRPESHHWSVCPLWNNHMIFLHFLWNCSTECKAFLTDSPLAYLPQYHIDIIFFIGHIVDHSHFLCRFRCCVPTENNCPGWETRPTFREVHNIVNCSPVFSFSNPSGFCWQYWRGQRQQALVLLQFSSRTRSRLK